MESGSANDRRSSIRVRSFLPCLVRTVDEEAVARLEARILDHAVVESDGVLHDVADWSERTEDLSREVVFVLNEIRALRQQITEIQRLVAADGGATEPRWVVINDKGVWLPKIDGEDELAVGAIVEVRMQIPSIQTPDILAVGEVIRVGEESGEWGTAIVFRSISQVHSKAIIRYALRRERQLARSRRAR